jgi:hypothetical protein
VAPRPSARGSAGRTSADVARPNRVGAMTQSSTAGSDELKRRRRRALPSGGAEVYARGQMAWPQGEHCMVTRVWLCAGARRGHAAESVGARVWRGSGGRERHVRGDGADATREEGTRGSERSGARPGCGRDGGERRSGAQPRFGGCGCGRGGMGCPTRPQDVLAQFWAS